MPDSQKQKYRYQKRARFWLSLASTLAELAAVAFLAFWLLPQFGIRLHWGVVAGVMVVLAAFDVFTYVAGTGALDRLPVHSASHVGEEAVVVSRLDPRGAVRLHGELWQAKSLDGTIEPKETVVVVQQDRLSLEVRRASSAGAAEEGL